MRLFSKLFKLSLLTAFFYGTFIVYEEVNLLLQELSRQEEGIISTDYQINYSNDKKYEDNMYGGLASPDQDVKITPPRPSEAELEEHYKSTFENFYTQVQSKVTELMQVASDEYFAKKESNEEISYFYFFTKYNRAAKNLESATDETFYNIYESFVTDLSKYGYDTSIADQYLHQYENKKEFIRTSIMKEAAKKF